MKERAGRRMKAAFFKRKKAEVNKSLKKGKVLDHAANFAGILVARPR